MLAVRLFQLKLWYVTKKKTEKRMLFEKTISTHKK